MIRGTIARLVALARVTLERRAQVRQDRRAARALRDLSPIRLSAGRHQRFTEDRRP